MSLQKTSNALPWKASAPDRVVIARMPPRRTAELRRRHAACRAKLLDCADADRIDIRPAAWTRTIVLARGRVNTVHEDVVAQPRRAIYFKAATVRLTRIGRSVHAWLQRYQRKEIPLVQWKILDLDRLHGVAQIVRCGIHQLCC